MSQETTNTFSEGLIMDLNPLTTPANTLTNCLNGTLITFNGNEFVLQNDMGNGRIETAYLPSGYVPVGIKEHGGIIYVASYNPITNRSQIGSFPSPERNISSEELSDIEKIISWSDFWNEDQEGNVVLNSTVARLQLSTNIIRSGDKFSIMMDSQEFSKLYKYISNFNNSTYENKDNATIKYLHNKLLTLQIATEDSQGNLIDITDSLKRTTIDDTGNTVVIEFDPKVAQNIKFNTGYFIQKFTANSSDLTQYRNSRALNTYNNKVFGNLYIVATLNNITNYSVSVYGYKNSSGTSLSQTSITLPDGQTDSIAQNNSLLIFEVEYQYNCPDGYIEETSSGKYSIDSCPTEDFEPNDVILGSHIVLNSNDIPNYNVDSHENFLVSSDQIVRENINKDYYKPIYNSETNLYTVNNYYKQVVSSTTGQIDYNLTPEMVYGKLTGLAINGMIDLSLLGSGKIELNTWKYYINQDNVDVTWGLSSYPLYNWEIKYIVFEFKDLSGNTDNYRTYVISGRESYNGIFTNNFDLKQDIIYVVKITILQNPIKTTTGEVDIESKYPSVIIKNFEENNQIVVWRTLICNQEYNQYYSKYSDFTKEIDGINISLVGETSINYFKNSNAIADDIELLYDPPTYPEPDKQYEEVFVQNDYSLSIKYDNSYKVSNSVFQLKDCQFQNSITNAVVTVSPGSIINDNPTFISQFEYPLILDSNNNGIVIQNDDIHIYLKVPFQFSRTELARTVETCYRPLKYDMKSVIGYDSDTLQDITRIVPHFGGKRGKRRVYRQVHMLSKLVELLIYKDNNGTNGGPMLQADCFPNIPPNCKSAYGLLPMFVAMDLQSYSDTRFRWTDGPGRGIDAIILLMRATDEQYYPILMQEKKRVETQDWSSIATHSNKVAGDLLPITTEIFLERIYTEQNHNETIICYVYGGGKYCEDIRGTCNINYLTTSNKYSISYSNQEYNTTNIDTWLANLNYVLGTTTPDIVKKSLLPKKIELNKTQTASVSIILQGSEIVKNQWNNIINQFNSSKVALIDYANKVKAIVITAEGSPLLTNYWYWLDVQTDDEANAIVKLVNPPQQLKDSFTLVDNIPVLNVNNIPLKFVSYSPRIGYDNDRHSRGWKFGSEDDGRRVRGTADISYILQMLVKLDSSYYSTMHKLIQS